MRGRRPTVTDTRASASMSASVLGGEGNSSSRSSDQPVLMASTSKPSRRTRILPHESQLGGTRILSRSMTLCLSGWRLRSDVMPRLEWIRLWRGEGTVGVV